MNSIKSKLIFLLLFSFGFILNLSAQNDSSKTDSVNISNLVHSQIEDIKSKEVQEKTHQAEPSESSNDKPVFLGLTEKVFIRIFLMVDVVLAAVLFIIWRRRKQRIAAELKAKFKNNIKKLREERIKGKEDIRLKTLRKNLQAHAICSDMNDAVIASQAKKLSISKGEIYLAAKIKSFNKDDDA